MSLERVEILILLFFTYSFMGWFMESVGGILNVKKFVNRGFLIGPYCPVYGIGVVIITVLLGKYVTDIPALFILSIVICGVLEYATSYFMEKLFNARWWDYSNKRFNINGRICLETLLPFGIAGTTIVCFINPFFEKIYLQIPDSIRHIITFLLSITFIIDLIISLKIILSFKGITYSENDNTEEISTKVKDKTEDMIMKAESEVIEFSRKVKVRGLRFQRKVRYTRKRLEDSNYSLKELLEIAQDHQEELKTKFLIRMKLLDEQLKLKKAEYESMQKESIEKINKTIEKTKSDLNELQEKVDNTIKNLKISSEEFSNTVKDNFKIKSRLSKRLIDAFPTMEVIKKEKKSKKR